MDGRRPCHRGPGRPGPEERHPVPAAERHLHHPAVHPGVHADQDLRDQREGPGAIPAPVRRDPCLNSSHRIRFYKSFINKIANQGHQEYQPDGPPTHKRPLFGLLWFGQ